MQSVTGQPVSTRAYIDSTHPPGRQENGAEDRNAQNRMDPFRTSPELACEDRILQVTSVSATSQPCRATAMSWPAAEVGGPGPRHTALIRPRSRTGHGWRTYQGPLSVELGPGGRLLARFAQPGQRSPPARLLPGRPEPSQSWTPSPPRDAVGGLWRPSTARAPLWFLIRLRARPCWLPRDRRSSPAAHPPWMVGSDDQHQFVSAYCSGTEPGGRGDAFDESELCRCPHALGRQRRWSSHPQGLRLRLLARRALPTSEVPNALRPSDSR